MANRNFNGVQINQSTTITEKAAVDMDDCRNRILAYNEDGNVVLASDGSKPFVGVALIESGLNDISGKKSGSVASGENIDIQIKDIGYILAGSDIPKGTEVTAGTDGMAAVAAAGDHVIGLSLSAVEKEEYCRVQITKYQKN